MTTENVYIVAFVQHDSNSPTVINQDPSCLPSPLRPHPTPHPTRLYSPTPKSTTGTQQPHQNTLFDSDTFPPETTDIFDYLIWSQINLLFGAIILGIPAVLLSMQTRKFKREVNVRGAKLLSKFSLIFNIFINVVFMGAMVFLLGYYSGFK
jgi:hypothetical protein